VLPFVLSGGHLTWHPNRASEFPLVPDSILRIPVHTPPLRPILLFLSHHSTTPLINIFSSLFPPPPSSSPSSLLQVCLSIYLTQPVYYCNPSKSITLELGCNIVNGTGRKIEWILFFDLAWTNPHILYYIFCDIGISFHHSFTLFWSQDSTILLVIRPDCLRIITIFWYNNPHLIP
jgi:hypothetical protein